MTADDDPVAGITEIVIEKPKARKASVALKGLRFFVCFCWQIFICDFKEIKEDEMLKRILGAFLMVLTFSGMSLAAHPLITDDAGTQGKGKGQFEINYEYAHESNGGVVENTNQIQAVLTFGVLDKVDFVVGFPYQFISTKAQGTKTTEDGLSDITLEVKWRFWEADGLSLALKPGIIVPSGEDEKGLGAGEVGYSIFFIATKELDPWAFHLNLGYGRIENTVDERTDIWYVSLASELKVFSWMKAVVNIGAEKNPDKQSETPPAFILGGLIFSVTEHLDLDIGVKGGLTASEDDYSILAGMTFRF